ncbi:MAG TPA: hypothetical protein VHT91_32545 [Kofleriaceae bacterium]|nr:hypothetical protein [Kofleriaceae bacterium]
MNDALRLEFRPSGIHVCLIEPGSIRTPAVDKTLGDVERAIQALPPDGREHYADMLRAFHRRAYQRERSGSAPKVVARAVHHALTAARPRIRYPVGQDARLLVTLPRVLPDRWLDEIRRPRGHCAWTRRARRSLDRCSGDEPRPRWACNA